MAPLQWSEKDSIPLVDQKKPFLRSFLLNSLVSSIVQQVMNGSVTWLERQTITMWTEGSVDNCTMLTKSDAAFVSRVWV